MVSTDTIKCYDVNGNSLTNIKYFKHLPTPIFYISIQKRDVPISNNSGQNLSYKLTNKTLSITYGDKYSKTIPLDNYKYGELILIDIFYDIIWTGLNNTLTISIVDDDSIQIPIIEERPTLMQTMIYIKDRLNKFAEHQGVSIDSTFHPGLYSSIEGVAEVTKENTVYGFIQSQLSSVTTSTNIQSNYSLRSIIIDYMSDNRNQSIEDYIYNTDNWNSNKVSESDGIITQTSVSETQINLPTKSKQWCCTFQVQLSDASRWWAGFDKINGANGWRCQYGMDIVSTGYPRALSSDNSASIEDTYAATDFPRNTYFNFTMIRWNDDIIMEWQPSNESYYNIVILKDYHVVDNNIGFSTWSGASFSIKDIEFYVLDNVLSHACSITVQNTEDVDESFLSEYISNTTSLNSSYMSISNNSSVPTVLDFTSLDTNTQVFLQLSTTATSVSLQDEDGTSRQFNSVAYLLFNHTGVFINTVFIIGNQIRVYAQTYHPTPKIYLYNSSTSTISVNFNQHKKITHNKLYLPYNDIRNYQIIEQTGEATFSTTNDNELLLSNTLNTLVSNRHSFSTSNKYVLSLYVKKPSGTYQGKDFDIIIGDENNRIRISFQYYKIFLNKEIDGEQTLLNEVSALTLNSYTHIQIIRNNNSWIFDIGDGAKTLTATTTEDIPNRFGISNYNYGSTVGEVYVKNIELIKSPDILFNDACTMVKESNYNSAYPIYGSSTSGTITYDSTENAYMLQRTGSSSNSDWTILYPIKSMYGKDNFVIEADVKSKHIAYNRIGFGFHDTNNKHAFVTLGHDAWSSAWRFFTGNSSSTSVQTHQDKTFTETWYHVEITVKGNNYICKIYNKETHKVIASVTGTADLNIASRDVGIALGCPSNSTSWIKNIKIKSLQI